MHIAKLMKKFQICNKKGNKKQTYAGCASHDGQPDNIGGDDTKGDYFDLRKAAIALGEREVPLRSMDEA